MKGAWQYARGLMDRHQPELRAGKNKRLVRFLFPRDRMDSEVLWLLANYINIVQEQCFARGATLLQAA